jgi:hypothetical protein
MARRRSLRPFNGQRGKETDTYVLPVGVYIVTTADGLGVKVRVSDGPHGLGVSVTPHVGTPDVELPDVGPRYIDVTQYRQTPVAQAFRRWYLHCETAEDVALLGPSYARKDGTR